MSAPSSVARYALTVYYSGRELAGQAVARHVAKKILRKPSEFPCADCGVYATEYDHRDYNKPVDVTPVCHKCNLRRGRDIWKRWGSFDEFWAWFEPLPMAQWWMKRGMLSKESILQEIEFDPLGTRSRKEIAARFLHERRHFLYGPEGRNLSEHRNLIEQCGGTLHLSRQFSLSPSAITRWKERGIPRKYLLQLQDQLHKSA